MAVASDNAYQSRDEGGRYRQPLARGAPVVADENDVNWVNVLPPARHTVDELTRRPTVITAADRQQTVARLSDTSTIRRAHSLHTDLVTTYVPATRRRSDVETSSESARPLTRPTASRDLFAPLDSTAGQ